MSEFQDPMHGLFRDNAEQALVQVVEQLIAARPDEQFRLMPDRHLAGRPGADYLLQVDDYDFRLEMLDAPGGQRRLPADRLRNTAALLEANPSTQALLYVWTTDTLDAVPLSLARIQFMLANPERIPGLLAQAQPLQAVIDDLIERQVKRWDLRLDPNQQPPGQRVDLVEVFDEEIGKAIDVEMSRNYRNRERSKAAEVFPYYEEKELLMSALRAALQGAETDELIERLAQVDAGGAV